jgi:hypothetical protein
LVFVAPTVSGVRIVSGKQAQSSAASNAWPDDQVLSLKVVPRQAVPRFAPDCSNFQDWLIGTRLRVLTV